MRARRLLQSTTALACAAAGLGPASAQGAGDRYELVSARADMALTASHPAGYAASAQMRVRSGRRFAGRLTLASGRTRLRGRPVSVSSVARASLTQPDGAVVSCEEPLAGRFDALRATVLPARRRVEVAWGLGAPVSLCPDSPDLAFPLLLYPPAGFNVATYERSLFRRARVVLPIDLRTSWTNASNGLSVSVAWTGKVVLRRVGAG